MTTGFFVVGGARRLPEQLRLVQADFILDLRKRIR
jgi:hypothetical protein